MKGKATASLSPGSHPCRRFGFVVALSCLAAPLPIRAAQENAATSAADSVALLEDAKEEQKKYERYRERRLPPGMRSFGGCDALVGRLCVRRDGTAPPLAAEPIEVEMARMELLRTLGRIGARIPRDRWVLGQHLPSRADLL